MKKDIGYENFKIYVENAPILPGVYRMLDIEGKILYIGKAKNIKNRLEQYLQVNNLTIRIQRMVSQIKSVEFIVCNTDNEAILLEANLIKSLKPKYNILLKDDKSFPYLLIRKDHKFGQLLKYRGNKKIDGKYFGPFASVKNLNTAIEELQKIFPLRTCSDTYLTNRTRPCIQYEIKRCSAPCVNKINEQEYQDILLQLEDFLKGNNKKIQEQLTHKMEVASLEMKYEVAAQYRDRIAALNLIQSKQYYAANIDDCDFIAVYVENYQCSIEIFIFRAGQNLGNKSYFPEQVEDMSVEEILSAFIANFYQYHDVPKEIIISNQIDDLKNYEELFSTKISVPKQGEKQRIIEFAMHNAKNSLQLHFQKFLHHQRILFETQKALNLKNSILRIDVFDNSHLSGTNAVSAMIVYEADVFNKKAYRIFKFKNADTQNDYDMMKEAVYRRYSKMLKEYSEYKEGEWPDLVLIDGGPGHLAVITDIFQELKLDIPLFCIAKGPKRNAGGETFYAKHMAPFTLPNDNVVMQFMQRLRDEAHRFAIVNHRKQKKKKEFSTSFDMIPFIGEKRKKMLLNFFGSVNAIMGASVDEMTKVKSISKDLANKIYDYFHK